MQNQVEYLACNEFDKRTPGLFKKNHHSDSYEKISNEKGSINWSWTLDTGLWTLDTGIWMMNSEHWILDAEIWTLWTLDSGCFTFRVGGRDRNIVAQNY